MTATIVEGPRVATQRCSCCGDEVPRLLPNGERNAFVLPMADCALANADVTNALSDLLHNEETPEICRSCHFAVYQLLGSVVTKRVLPDLRLGEKGLGDTLLIGAVIPNEETGGQIYFFSANGNELILEDITPLREFNELLLYYPHQRGDMDPLIWALYEGQAEYVREKFE